MNGRREAGCVRHRRMEECQDTCKGSFCTKFVVLHTSTWCVKGYLCVPQKNYLFDDNSPGNNLHHETIGATMNTRKLIRNGSRQKNFALARLCGNISSALRSLVFFSLSRNNFESGTKVIRK